MKAHDKLQTLVEEAVSFGKQWSPRNSLRKTEGGERDYPQKLLDLVIFHQLHVVLSAEHALRGYRALKEDFVDWNEVRVSSIREIQEALGLCPNSLELSVFIKDLLELLHRERQDVSLEFLAEKSLGEIRQYLKRFRTLDTSTAEFLIRTRREHPVLPLSHSMEVVLNRLGILGKGDSRPKNEKTLHESLDPSQSLLLHHYLLNHAVEVCPPDENEIDCPSCNLRHMCAFYARSGKKPRRIQEKDARPAARHSKDRSAKAPRTSKPRDIAKHKPLRKISR